MYVYCRHCYHLHCCRYEAMFDRVESIGFSLPAAPSRSVHPNSRRRRRRPAAVVAVIVVVAVVIVAACIQTVLVCVRACARALARAKFPGELEDSGRRMDVCVCTPTVRWIQGRREDPKFVQAHAKYHPKPPETERRLRVIAQMGVPGSGSSPARAALERLPPPLPPKSLRRARRRPGLIWNAGRLMISF